MLSNMHYYHRTIRKMVVAFGTIFNNLKLVRYNLAGDTEIERINVPLSYASKEKFYTRMTKDPDLLNPTQISLPRMAFEFNGLTYDPNRKTSSFAGNFGAGTGANSVSEVKRTPYNFDFSLYIFIRNTEEGTQLVEQILPYFTPDYTVTIDFLSLDNLKIDVPIIFNTITYEDTHEGDTESTRTLIWTLNFTVKGYLFGPVTQVPIIRQSYANIAYDLKMGIYNGIYHQYKVRDGFGAFKTGELVYQGSTLDEAYAKAYVREWYTANGANTGTLTLYDEMGSFRANNDIVGAVTNANWTFTRIEPKANAIISIGMTHTPNTANIGDDFGFSENIEYLLP